MFDLWFGINYRVDFHFSIQKVGQVFHETATNQVEFSLVTITSQSISSFLPVDNKSFVTLSQGVKIDS